MGSFADSWNEGDRVLYVEKVGDTWTGVVTAGDACATGTAEMGAKPYLSANRRCRGLELPGAVLAGTVGNFPFEEEGVGGSSPRRDVVKGYNYGVTPAR